MANASLNETRGEVEDMEFEIKGIKIYCQVQIVGEASYKVLLGRPFFVWTRAVTADTEDGNTTLMITDPISKRTITIPTEARNPRNYSEDF